MADRYPPSLRDLLDRPDDARAIGPFRLVRQLGRGGFAPVWLAKETFGEKELRVAAVKLFALDAVAPGAPPSSHDSAAAHHRDAVVEEAQALCRVEHPNVVRFYALPLDEARGVIGLAMEYVAGTPLDARLRDEGKLSVRETLEVGLAVARALAAVHAAGLVHRDVKPANVVESNRVYKLIDFGIASAEAPPPNKTARKVVLDDLPIEIVGTKMSMLASAYTVDGAGNPSGAPSSLPFSATGTVGYIDPVCVQTGAHATPASDLYGLGAMLYECLTGKLPALAAAPAGAGLRGEVLDGRTAPPKLRDLDVAIPEPLAAIVDALVAPSRDARPPSARDVAASLDAIVQDRAVPTPPPPAAASPTAPSPPTAAPPSARRRWVAPAIALASLAAAGMIAVVSSRAAPPPPNAASAARSAAPRDCELGDLAGCTSACDDGRAASCQTLAAMYQTNTGVPKDLTRAQALYTKACDLGSQLACYKLGAILEAALDYPGALARYTKACDAGDPQACNAAGALYWSGNGAPRDTAHAVALFQRACDAAYEGACASLAVAYDRGEGVAADPARAAQVYDEACQHGALNACADLATMSVTGRGTSPDPARAAALYQRACDGDTPRACQGLGALYEAGLGVPKDPKRAAALYSAACEKKEWASCTALGHIDAYGDPAVRDEASALGAFQRACDGGDAEGCKSVADFYAHGTYVVKNAGKAKELYARACDAGAADACDAGVLTATAPALPLPLPAPKPACNCQAGDPLCSCL